MSPSRPPSIEAVMLQHGPFLRRLARALVRDEHAAEDLVHDTWLAALRGAPVAARDVRAWLAAVLRRRATSLRRKQGSEDLEAAWRERPQVGPAADETTLALERERLLHDAVARLEEPYRTAVFLRYHEGLAPRAIAARTGAPVKTVMTRLGRGRERLRADLDRTFSDRRDPRAGWLAVFVPFASSGAAAPVASYHVPGVLLAMKVIVPVVVLVLLGIFLIPRLGVSDQGLERVAVVEVEREIAGPQPPAIEGAELALESPKATARDAVDTEPADVDNVAWTAGIEVIVTAANGDPIVGRSIMVDGPLRGSMRRESEVGVTGADGHVTFGGLAALRYRVADGRGSATEWVGLESGETHTLHWTLTDNVLVKGRVVHVDGSGASGATIWASQNTRTPETRLPLTVTDGEGHFELTASKQITLHASLAGFLPSTGRPTGTLLEAKPGVRTVELRLGAVGSSLTGRVLDPDGAPIKGARVVAGPLGGALSADWEGVSTGPVVVRTDADGRFIYPHALPEGPQEVGAYASGYAVKLIEVTADGTSLDVELILMRPASIAGQVLLPDGSAASGAQVIVRAVGGGPAHMSIVPVVTGVVDEAGRFSLGQVMTGTFVVACQTAYDQPLALIERTLTVESGQTIEVELRLSDQPVIAGRIVDADGVAVEGLSVSAEVDAGGQAHPRTVKSAADGAFRLTAVPAFTRTWTKSWVIEVHSRSGASSQLLVREEGVMPGTEDLVLVVARPEAATAFLEGQLVAATPKVPADTELTIWREDTRSGAFATFDADSGRFRFGPVAPGLYRVQVRRGQETVATKSGIELKAGETVDVGPITFGMGGHVVVTPRLADLHGLPAAVEGILMSGGRPILTDDSGRTLWLEPKDNCWVSTSLVEPGTWTFSATGEKTIYPVIEFEVVDGETIEVECVARIGYDVTVWMAMPSEASWDRVRIRVLDPGGDLLHATDWTPRGDLKTADRVTAKMTLPIGDVEITVETDTDVGASKTVTVPAFDAPIREIQIVD